MTHSNPLAFEACYLYCFAISILIKTGERTKAFYETYEESKKREVHEDIRLTYLFDKVKQCKGFQQAQNVLPKASGQHIGDLRIAFAWSLYFLLNFQGYDKCMREVLILGGDTDTNAAIVGGMVGALCGVGSIDRKMVEKLLAFRCDSQENIERFLVKHVRPDFLIPGKGLPHIVEDLIRHAPTRLRVIVDK